MHYLIHCSLFDFKTWLKKRKAANWQQCYRQLFQHNNVLFVWRKCYSLHEMCPYSEFYWSFFSRIQIEYGEIRSISSYLVRMRENMDQKNAVNKHFSCSATTQEIKFSAELVKPEKLQFLCSLIFFGSISRQLNVLCLINCDLATSNVMFYYN